MDHYDREPVAWLIQCLDAVQKPTAENCQSPIEIGLLRGLIALRLGDRRIKFADWPGGELLTEWEAVIHTQYSVGSYRLDFAVEVRKDGCKSAWLGIECDGHDFHDRTKEQAARDKGRDRELAIRGFRMMRFTGSEIFRNNMACALEVYEAVVALANEVFQ